MHTQPRQPSLALVANFTADSLGQGHGAVPAPCAPEEYGAAVDLLHGLLHKASSTRLPQDHLLHALVQASLVPAHVVSRVLTNARIWLGACMSCLGHARQRGRKAVLGWVLHKAAAIQDQPSRREGATLKELSRYRCGPPKREHQPAPAATLPRPRLHLPQRARKGREGPGRADCRLRTREHHQSFRSCDGSLSVFASKQDCAARSPAPSPIVLSQAGTTLGALFHGVKRHASNIDSSILDGWIHFTVVA